MSNPIKNGDYVKVSLQKAVFYGYVIAKKPLVGVMRYTVRTESEVVLRDLYVTQLSHSVREEDDE